MRLIAAFFKLVRLPNLLFIALTQVLFQYCIYLPIYGDNVPGNDTLRFILIVLASLLIAAAGYIINDYFDINIDEVNKPERVVVDKIISRRWAIAWHFMLSVTGIGLTIIALPFFQFPHLVMANVFCVILLWFYSTNYKKTLAIGNIVISLLTAWTILIIFFSKFPLGYVYDNGVLMIDPKFFRLTFLYAAFAFIISLVREAIKDMEDLPGDSRYGCKTMPVVWGMNSTRVYVTVWVIVLLAGLSILEIYVLPFRWWWPAIYNLVLVIVPLALILYRLFQAKEPKDYGKISSLTKAVMLTGTLSMIFFYFYL
ncbi:MAG: geranylgeranylglycerol-phosphate geranylgeranyltransferase [Chitinophagaceae bacterium]|nr:geranylgeranylglycerol-phosphate geranylgeranyltransferase [Chitinophagaceae bacterium]MBN8667841.1 geranylgeranylglycerol-phosphate geranylgeranyltransferase [Chitinophagales bacterium]